MQPLLDVGQDPGYRQYRQDRALIADGLHAEAKQVPGRYFDAGTQRIGVEQIRVYHDHAHGRTQIRVAAKAFGRREADQHRQEGERRIGEDVDAVCQIAKLRK